MVVARHELRRPVDFRLAVDRDVDLRERREGKNIREGRGLGAQAFEDEEGERRAGKPARRRIGESVVLAATRHPAARALSGAQQHELVCIPDRQRAQQDVVDETEDRGVGAYAKRERNQGDGRRSRALQQLAEGETDVLHREPGPFLKCLIAQPRAINTGMCG